MKSIKETVMICALVLTLLLVANVQVAEGDCCFGSGGFFGLGASENRFHYLIPLFL
jgi:hypothetical protein